MDHDVHVRPRPYGVLVALERGDKRALTAMGRAGNIRQREMRLAEKLAAEKAMRATQEQEQQELEDEAAEAIRLEREARIAIEDFQMRIDAGEDIIPPD